MRSVSVKVAPHPRALAAPVWPEAPRKPLSLPRGARRRASEPAWRRRQAGHAQSEPPPAAPGKRIRAAFRGLTRELTPELTCGLGCSGERGRAPPTTDRSGAAAPRDGLPRAPQASALCVLAQGRLALAAPCSKEPFAETARKQMRCPGQKNRNGVQKQPPRLLPRASLPPPLPARARCLRVLTGTLRASAGIRDSGSALVGS